VIVGGGTVRVASRRDPRLIRRMAVLIVGLLAAACVRTVKTIVPVPAERTVESVVEDLGPSVRARWAPLCHAVGLYYPPPQLALLAFKRERRLEIWGRQNGPWVPIDAMPVLAASGVPGPKLREGDGQVPEGFYRIVAFNPNSRYHLSLMLDYPNADDLIEGERDGRTDLGGEIFVHGGARSIGCLAVGDYAIESLFVLVADVGIENVQVIIAPRDPRGGITLEPIADVPFTTDLYRRIEDGLRAFGGGPAER